MFVAVLRRSLLCACSLAFALGVAEARADALQDARSAYEAKADGNIDESIRLYSNAIDAGELMVIYPSAAAWKKLIKSRPQIS